MTSTDQAILAPLLAPADLLHHRHARIPVTGYFLNSLSMGKRQMLLAHVDRPQPIRNYDGNATMFRRALIAENLLQCDHRRPPRMTSLTTRGRECVSLLLATIAERMVERETV